MAPSQHNASTSTQLNFSNKFEEVLLEYKNDLANMLKENLVVDVRGKSHTYQNCILFTWILFLIQLVLGCLILLRPMER